MKKSILLAISLLICVITNAQKKEDIEKREQDLKYLLSDPHYCDSVKNADSIKRYKKKHYTDYQYITNYSLNRLIRQDLTKITLSEDGLPVIGNYASLKYSDDNTKVTLNTSFYNPFKKSAETDPIKSILSINVKAGISDGVATLFTNKNVNSGVGVRVKMTFLTRKTNYESTSVYNCVTLAIYRDRLLDNYNLEGDKFKLDSSLKKKEFDERIRKLGDQAKALPLKTDSLQLLCIKETQTYNLYMSKNRRFNKADIIDQYYKSLLEIETKNVKWKSFAIEFWNVDIGFSGDKYNTFDKSQPISAQLGSQNFTNWNIGTSFNHFSSNSTKAFIKNGIFYKIGYSLSNSNNFAGAKTKSITNTVTIDTPSFKREVVDKVDAYEGPFKKFYAHNLNVQLSKYLNEKKSNALSLYSSLVQNFDKLNKPLNIQNKPNWTLGTGYLLSLLDKDKEKAVVNFEVYFNFYDVINSFKDENTKFYQRRDLGLKIGIPFNSIFLNQ